MRFLIDGEEWSFSHMDLLSREELLDVLREKVSSDDRLIVDMLCDGEALDDKDFMNVPDDILVEVHTNTPYGLGLEILDEVKTSLLDVFKALQSALDSGEPFKASCGLGSADEEAGTLYEAQKSLCWINEVLKGIGEAYPEYEEMLPCAEPLLAGLNDFSAFLSDGRYARAQEWHEREWKQTLLPPFLEDLKRLKDWLERGESAQVNNELKSETPEVTHDELA